MITWTDFIEQGIEHDKKAKKDSREIELFLLKQKKESNINPDLLDQGVKLENEYRNILDDEIKRQKNELIETKNGGQ